MVQYYSPLTLRLALRLLNVRVNVGVNVNAKRTMERRQTGRPTVGPHSGARRHHIAAAAVVARTSRLVWLSLLVAYGDLQLRALVRRTDFRSCAVLGLTPTAGGARRVFLVWTGCVATCACVQRCRAGAPCQGGGCVRACGGIRRYCSIPYYGSFRVSPTASPLIHPSNTHFPHGHGIASRSRRRCDLTGQRQRSHRTATRTRHQAACTPPISLASCRRGCQPP